MTVADIFIAESKARWPRRSQQPRSNGDIERLVNVAVRRESKLITCNNDNNNDTHYDPEAIVVAIQAIAITISTTAHTDTHTNAVSRASWQASLPASATLATDR